MPAVTQPRNPTEFVALAYSTYKDMVRGPGTEQARIRRLQAILEEMAKANYEAGVVAGREQSVTEMAAAVQVVMPEGLVTTHPEMPAATEIVIPDGLAPTNVLCPSCHRPPWPAWAVPDGLRDMYCSCTHP